MSNMPLPSHGTDQHTLVVKGKAERAQNARQTRTGKRLGVALAVDEVHVEVVGDLRERHAPTAVAHRLPHLLSDAVLRQVLAAVGGVHQVRDQPRRLQLVHLPIPVVPS